MLIHRIKKITSFLLTFFLLVSDLARANPELLSSNPIEGKQTFDILLPQELGSVRETYLGGKPNQPFIFHLQTIHANYESALKTKEIIRYLESKYKTKLVFVEGASDRLHPEFLQFFPDPKMNARMLDLLAQKGELTGVDLSLAPLSFPPLPEARTVMHSATGAVSFPHALDGNLEARDPRQKISGMTPVVAVGIESAVFYRSAFKDFKKVIANLAESEAVIAERKRKLNAQASKIFSHEFRELVNLWQKHEANQRDFNAVVKFLKEESKNELDLDFDNLFSQFEWPQMTRLALLTELEKRSEPAQFEKEKGKLIAWFAGKKIHTDFIQNLDNSQREERDPPSSSLRAPQSGAKQSRGLGTGSAISGIASGTSYHRNDKEVGGSKNPRIVYEKFLKETYPQGFQFKDYPQIMYRVASQVLQAELEPQTLSSEINRLFEQLFLKKAKTPEELALFRKYQRLNLFEKLLKLELTREEWESVKAQVPFPKVPGSILSAVQPGTFGNGTSAIYRAALHFYRFCEKREQVFYQKLSSEMTARHEKTAILVTGGFHSDGMSRIFKEKGMGFAEILPRISGDIKSTLYHQIMLGTEFHNSGTPPRTGRSGFRSAHMEIADPAQPLDSVVSQTSLRYAQRQLTSFQNTFREVANALSKNDYDLVQSRAPYFQNRSSNQSYQKQTHRSEMRSKLTDEEITRIQPQYQTLREFFGVYPAWQKVHPDTKLVFFGRFAESMSDLFQYSQSEDSFSPLTLRGLAQAKAMAAVFKRIFMAKDFHFDRYVTNSLERGYRSLGDTAAAVGTKPEILNRLREVLVHPEGGIPLGVLEKHYPGRSGKFNENPAAFKMGKFNRGPTVEDYLNRLKTSLETIPDKHLMMTAHEMTLALSLMNILKIPYEKYVHFQTILSNSPHLGMTVLAYTPGTKFWELLVYGDDSYLPSAVRGRSRRWIEKAMNLVFYYAMASVRFLFVSRSQIISDYRPGFRTFFPFSEKMAVQTLEALENKPLDLPGDEITKMRIDENNAKVRQTADWVKRELVADAGTAFGEMLDTAEAYAIDAFEKKARHLPDSEKWRETRRNFLWTSVRNWFFLTVIFSFFGFPGAGLAFFSIPHGLVFSEILMIFGAVNIALSLHLFWVVRKFVGDANFFLPAASGERKTLSRLWDRVKKISETEISLKSMFNFMLIFHLAYSGFILSRFFILETVSTGIAAAFFFFGVFNVGIIFSTGLGPNTARIFRQTAIAAVLSAGFLLIAGQLFFEFPWPWHVTAGIFGIVTGVLRRAYSFFKEEGLKFKEYPSFLEQLETQMDLNDLELTIRGIARESRKIDSLFYRASSEAEADIDGFSVFLAHILLNPHLQQKAATGVSRSEMRSAPFKTGEGKRKLKELQRERDKLETLLKKRGQNLTLRLVHLFHESPLAPEKIPGFENADFHTYELPRPAVRNFLTGGPTILREKTPFWSRFLESSQSLKKRGKLKAVIGVNNFQPSRSALNRALYHYTGTDLGEGFRQKFLITDEAVTHGAVSEAHKNIALVSEQDILPRLNASQQEDLKRKKILFLHEGEPNPLGKSPLLKEIILYKKPSDSVRALIKELKNKYGATLLNKGMSEEDLTVFLIWQYLRPILELRRDATQLQLIFRSLRQSLEIGDIPVPRPLLVLHFGGALHYQAMNELVLKDLAQDSPLHLENQNDPRYPLLGGPIKGFTFFVKRFEEVVDHIRIKNEDVDVDVPYFVALFEEFLKTENRSLTILNVTQNFFRAGVSSGAVGIFDLGLSKNRLMTFLYSVLDLLDEKDLHQLVRELYFMGGDVSFLYLKLRVLLTDASYPA